MSNTKASRTEELFLQAVDMPQEARRDWLRDQCAGDEALRDRIERLLAEDSSPGDEFLARPIVGFTGVSVAPKRVGGYAIVGIAGEGGMGEVYEAVHQATGRRAAVKLLRMGGTSRKHIERFRIEAEMLGRLNEPGIAQLFDAGVSEIEFDDGARAARPFIAMEFAPGKSITAHARERTLPPNECVRIVEQVARSVQHAHQRGVIHRDLKPGNILVAPDGSTKIVDFGVARLVEGAEQGLTVTGQMIGTVRYMSPEQASGDLSRVDTRTDVYSLGAILYELLAGRPLIDSPSGSTHGAVSQMLAGAPMRLACVKPELRGNIDAVVHKAIERDPRDRYQSAGEMADDLARAAKGEAVTARAPTTVERFTRTVARHKALSALATVAVLSLVAGAGVSIWQARVARTEAQRASQAAAFASEQLKRANEESARAGAASRLASEEAANAIAERNLMRGGREAWMSGMSFMQNVMVSSAASNAQFRDRILKNMDAMLERLDPVDPMRPFMLTTKLDAAAEIFDALGNKPRSLALRRESLAILEQYMGPDDQMTLMERALVATIAADSDQTESEKSERIIRECREKLAEFHSGTDPFEIRIAQGHAQLLRRLKRYDECEAEYLKLIEVVCGDDSSSVKLCLHVRGMLGILYRQIGRPAEAEPLVKGIVDFHIENQILDMSCVNLMDHLGQIYEDIGNKDRAIEIYSSRLDIAQQVTGAGSTQTGNAGMDLSRVQCRSGFEDDGVAMLDQSFKIIAARGTDRDVLVATCDAAIILLEISRLDDLERIIAEAKARLGEKFVLTDNYVYSISVSEAKIAVRRARYDEAEKSLKALYEFALHSPDLKKYPKVLSGLLATVYEATNKPEEAQLWRDREK